MEDIRELELEDYSKGVLELYEQNFDIDSSKIDKKDFSKYILNKRKSNYKIFVIEYNFKIIGIASCFIEQKLIHNFGKVSHIEDVIIDKNFRNKGLGKKIIKKCIDYSKSNNCYKIILDCFEEKKEFYEKCGFSKKGCFMSLYF